MRSDRKIHVNSRGTKLSRLSSHSREFRYIKPLDLRSGRLCCSYKKPFDKIQRFGKSRKGHESESRAKRLLTWINCEPITVVNRLQADFTKRMRPSVGHIRYS